MQNQKGFERMKRTCSAMFAGPLLAAGMALAQPATADTAPATEKPAPVASPRVVMLRLYVSDIARGESFYRQVFGTNVVQKMGDKVRIMMFPGGMTPGIILIQSPEVATMHGSFVIQVPDLKAVLEKAAANGGTLKNTHFEQKMAGMPAQSSHFSDPDGNLIEVLQIGSPAMSGKH